MCVCARAGECTGWPQGVPQGAVRRLACAGEQLHLYCVAVTHICARPRNCTHTQHSANQRKKATRLYTRIQLHRQLRETQTRTGPPKPTSALSPSREPGGGGGGGGRGAKAAAAQVATPPARKHLLGQCLTHNRDGVPPTVSSGTAKHTLPSSCQLGGGCGEHMAQRGARLRTRAAASGGSRMTALPATRTCSAPCQPVPLRHQHALVAVGPEKVLQSVDGGLRGLHAPHHRLAQGAVKALYVLRRSAYTRTHTQTRASIHHTGTTDGV
jgi:hypothetical protein